MAGPGQNGVSIAPAKGGSYNQPKQEDKKIDVKSNNLPPSIYTTSPAPAWSSTASGISGLPSSPVPFNLNLTNPFSMEEWERKALEEQAMNQQLARDAALAMNTGDVAERRMWMRPTEAVTDALQPAPTATDWMAKAFELIGTGPNYDEYRQKLAEEVMRTNARAAAMYKELAKENEANVKRAKDIYTEGGSDLDRLYRQAEADVAGAYEQAAKARGSEAERLGIEEAFAIGAPAEARAQGASVADLVKGRAAGLGRMAEVGTAAAGRANEMGGVYQQRGGEYQQAQLDRLNAQLLNNLFQQEQQMYNARLQAPGLAQQLYQASQLGVDTGPTYDQQIKIMQIEADARSNDIAAQQRAEQAKIDLIAQLGDNGAGQIDIQRGLEAYNLLLQGLGIQ
jgi:hypothetical protein